MALKRAIKDVAKEASYGLFKVGQRLGVNLIPNHYYVPIADVNRLRETKNVWARPSALAGIEMDLQAQSEFLSQACLPFQNEIRDTDEFAREAGGEFGPGFGYIEAKALHCIVRHLKPKRVVEVGSGASSYCLWNALRMNGEGAELVCVEPYPSPALVRLGATLIRKRAETLPASFFTDRLECGDLLFIDSSHTVRVGGDVAFLYLEVIPQLKPGVIVHVHDIYLPYQYSPDILTTYMQWCETVLLQALLTNNSRLRILACMSALHHAAPDDLKALFPDYSPEHLPDGLRPRRHDGEHFPASTFLVTG